MASTGVPRDGCSSHCFPQRTSIGGSSELSMSSWKERVIRIASSLIFPSVCRTGRGSENATSPRARCSLPEAAASSRRRSVRCSAQPASLKHNSGAAKWRGKAFQSRRSRSHRRLSRSTRCSGDARERGVSSVRFTPRFASGRSPAVALWQSCQGRRETRPKGGAKHCHRGRGGEVVRGGRDWAWGGGSRKRREGVARLEFPAEDGATISLRGRFSSRGCG